MVNDSFTRFQTILELKRYSPNTVQVYLSMLQSFQNKIGDKPLSELNNEELVEASIKFIREKNYSISSQKQLLGSLKLYFTEIENRKVDLMLIYPSRKQHFLPQVLAKEEIRDIIEATPNLKHKTMLMTIYALGLRQGELLDLKIKDVDGKRHLVHIKNSKGNKDRILPLSKTLLKQLREYYKVYRPKDYLFQGARGNRYSGTSLRNVFVRACKKANIQKKVTLHTLRHSFATHLMDSGTDVRLIQELLGHNSIKTTMQYTHVTTRSISRVVSPIEDL